jgi:putative membrane protein
MTKIVVVLVVIGSCLFLSCLPWHQISCPPGWPIIWFGCGTVLTWFIYLALICLVVYFILKSSGTKKDTESPLDILKRRYAKGELTRKEFNKMRDELRD